MLLDPVALAWASWAGLAVGVVGTLVSLVGLVLTFREARRARTAADRARDEVERVVALLRFRSRLATLASGVSQIDLLLERVQQDGLKGAPESLTSLRRSLIEVGLAPGGDDPAIAARLSSVLEDLATVDKLVWSDIEEKARKAQMATMLQSVRDGLMQLEAMAKLEGIA